MNEQNLNEIRLFTYIHFLINEKYEFRRNKFANISQKSLQIFYFVYYRFLGAE